MNVQLTPELEEMVHSKVESGRYESESDVMRVALKLLDTRDQAIDDLRQKIKHGLEDADAGRVSDGEEFMEQMLAEIDEEIRLEDEVSARELVRAQ